MIYVYVIKSEKTGYRYIGQTNNLTRRIQEHNGGMTKSIKYQVPFTLVYREEFEDRKSALVREKFLKSGKGREWLKNNQY